MALEALALAWKARPDGVKAYGDYTLVITGSGACYIGKTILKFERRSYR
jgi:hypothetical protein